ncbi:MAG TPA: phage portal protein [Bacteroidales bacterium]|nr:phage portal protein [Bacteroidales bacterium]
MVFLKDKPARPDITKILSLKPNSVMEAGAFWEKVGRNYYLENNVFIYIDWDLSKPKEPLKGLWILDPDNIDVIYNEQSGDVFLEFQLQGKNIVAPLDDIIHIARNVDTTEIFGKRDNAINSVLKVINTNYEGIEQAIKNSAFLRFVLASTSPMNEQIRKKRAESFAENYLAKDGTGVAYIDATETLTQIKDEAKYANANEMEHFENKILNYLNISESILKADFNENQWQAYYETNIESFVNKLLNELNFKLFTNREYGEGNRVVISSDILHVISTQTKINLLEKTKEIGLFTINEYRKLFNMAPIEGGEKRLVSLNYINADNADDYQLSKKEDKENIEEGEEDEE